MGLESRSRAELNVKGVRQGDETALTIFLGYAILETAINTFVDGDRHKVFESDTDLAYPPDMTRFLNFLGSTVHTGIAYCERVAAVAVERAQLPNFKERWPELAAKAGMTDFAFITRKG